MPPLSQLSPSLQPESPVHPAARWLTARLRDAPGRPVEGAFIYGITIVDPEARCGQQMARSSFIGHRPGMRPDDQSDLDLPAEAAEDQFDAVAVVHWIDGSAAVTRLFVNP